MSHSDFSSPVTITDGKWKYSISQPSLGGTPHQPRLLVSGGKTYCGKMEFKKIVDMPWIPVKLYLYLLWNKIYGVLVSED